LLKYIEGLDISPRMYLPTEHKELCEIMITSGMYSLR
jgi:hypothetical protein